MVVCATRHKRVALLQQLRGGDAGQTCVDLVYTGDSGITPPPVDGGSGGSVTKLNDSATIAAQGINPGGSMTFYLFAPGVTPASDYSNNVYSDQVTVNGNGTCSGVQATGSETGGASTATAIQAVLGEGVAREIGRDRTPEQLASARNPQFKDVPTLNETLGINYSVGAWRGIGAPKTMPADIQAKLTAALKKAFARWMPAPMIS